MKEKLANPNYNVNIEGRNRSGLTWRWIFQASTIIGIIALTALLLNIINSAFGYVALQAKVDPATLAVDGIALEHQSKDQLITVLQANIPIRRLVATAALTRSAELIRNLLRIHGRLLSPRPTESNNDP